tara:strand:- start:991 stop:1254 length:264 start_codon:yes stop_codon:yes gene_type:complete
MSIDDDHKDNIVDLSEWRKKKITPKPKVIWVSHEDPKLIIRLNPADLTLDFTGYKSNYKCFFKRFSLVEIVEMVVAIQTCLTPPEMT